MSQHILVFGCSGFGQSFNELEGFCENNKYRVKQYITYHEQIRNTKLSGLLTTHNNNYFFIHIQRLLRRGLLIALANRRLLYDEETRRK